MGWKSDEDIDAIFIIDGEEAEDDEEWKGLTQTMNRNFKEQIGLVNDKVALVNDKVALVNDKVALVKEDISDKVALVNDKVALVMQEVKLAQEATKAQLD